MELIKPIFDETKDFPASLFIKAVRYAVNEWEAICRYVNNGQAEIDNNAVEWLMKPICVGRNNYLFVARNRPLKYVIVLFNCRKLQNERAPSH